MEYCSKGDLAAVIKKHKESKQSMDEGVIWNIFVYVLLALCDCHHKKDMPILHRDIKPANIFISDGDILKLGDFGLSKELNNQSKYAYTNVGTPYYMSPEQVKEEKYNIKSDIWSLGCILYEAACLRPPFLAENYLSLAVKIKEGKFPKIPSQYSTELQELI